MAREPPGGADPWGAAVRLSKPRMSESKAVPSKLDPADAPEFSVVIPIYRNAASLIELLDRLDLVLADESREYVFVVDGSPDDSLELSLIHI